MAKWLKIAIIYIAFVIQLQVCVTQEEFETENIEEQAQSDEWTEDGEELFLSVEKQKNREDDLEDVWAMRSWDGEVKWDDDVAILNGRNFERFIKKVPHVLVEFYAQWCGHCQKFEPVYRRAASHLRMEA